MNKAFYIFSFLIMAHFNSFSQNSVNDYKYILIPSQFEFLNQKDQFQINSLTKFLFNKYGYVALMQDEVFPNDLRNNRCLSLTADVVKEDGLFKTKLRIDLKDCNGNLIQSSQTGETREKEFDKAYNLALRDAFQTFQNMQYEYRPNETILFKETSTVEIKTEKEQEEIALLKEEIKNLKEDKTEYIIVEETIPNKKAAEDSIEEVIPQETIEPMHIDDEKEINALYAQSVESGFQIVDSSPKVIMILYATAAKDVFIVKDKNAIVFKKEGQWIYSENDGKTVKETVLHIKF